MLMLSAEAAETLTAMGILSAFFIVLLHFLGFPVTPLYHLVRSIVFSLLFLILYNRIFSPAGLGIGINPLTVGALSLFGVEGFAAIHVVLLLTRVLI